jgi:hypothetical protein
MLDEELSNLLLNVPTDRDAYEYGELFSDGEITR